MIKSDRARQELFTDCFLAKVGFDTAENEPRRVGIRIGTAELALHASAGLHPLSHGLSVSQRRPSEQLCTQYASAAASRKKRSVVSEANMYRTLFSES